MWQEIAIIIIGITTVLYAGWNIYKRCIDLPKSNVSCIGCKGCLLKNQKHNANHSFK